MNDQLRRMWKKKAVANFKMEGLGKTTKNLSQDSKFPGRDWNRAPAEWKWEGMPPELACLVMACKINDK
jgi:hypothetical protein